MSPTLSTAEAARFYDRLGAGQDRQAFYEDRALEVLTEHGAFERAAAVVELGCGTGRFAERLLAELLPAEAVYRGFDLSAEMVALSRRRLEPFATRAEISKTDGSLDLPLPASSCDRFVSNYVADLLAESQIADLVREAGRLLVPNGRLGLVSLTTGCSFASGLVARLWGFVHRLRPRLVGGCRPLELLPYLEAEGGWSLVHHRRVVAWGIPSEVLVALREG